jgi:arginyl-tRNA synthetase
MAASTSAFNGVALLSQLPALPTHPDADPKRNPLDVFRLAIASQVTEIIPEIKLQDAFPGVHVPIRGADFCVPMPRFRVPGTKPLELAEKVVKEVSNSKLLVTIAARSPSSHTVQIKCIPCKRRS